MSLNSYFADDANCTGRNLRALSLSQDTIRLDWDSPLSGVISGFNIFRAFDIHEELKYVGTTTELNYIDSGIGPKREYYYRITTIYSGDGDSNSSFIPSGLTLGFSGNIDNRDARIDWQPPSDTSTITGYRVYRATNSFEQMTAIGSTTELSYTDSGIGINLPYYYRVRAIFI